MVSTGRELAGEVAELRRSVELLAGNAAALQRSIDQAREQSERDRAEYDRRLTEQAEQVDKVERNAATTETVNAHRAAVTRRFRIAFVLAAVMLMALSALGTAALQYRDTARHFSRVQQGLLDGCLARQRSDETMRTKNEALRDDTVALARAFSDSPAAAQLRPVIDYLNAEAGAYAEYLAALPPPTDCKARYGR
jgi:hypothetical protein